MVLVESTTVAAASRSLGLSVPSASRYLGYFRDTGGELHYAPDQWNLHADNVCHDPWLRAAVLTAVDEHPELFLDEMADAVNFMEEEVGAGVEVSAVTVGRILSRNGLSCKVIERAFLTGNEEQRALGWRRSGVFLCAVASTSMRPIEGAGRRSGAGGCLCVARVLSATSRRALECARAFSLLWSMTSF